MAGITRQARDELQRAYSSGRLTLYLGAGVSVGSGLPTWQRLILAMYLDLLSQNDTSAYANYLHAVAEWMLDKSPDPLEVTAQKIRTHHGPNDREFLEHLRRQLYAPFFHQGRYHVPSRKDLRKGNATLRAVAQLVERSAPTRSRGIEAVITYNYDNLLELALRAGASYEAVYGADRERPRSLPIYHVHGYVPILGTSSHTSHSILFTEEQYHEASNSAYAWSNLVQIRGLSGTTGLMVGLSLSDRNIRRLLHALGRSPVRARVFAVLPRPKWEQPYDHEEAEVHQMAQEIYRRAHESGSPVPGGYGIKGSNWQQQVREILNQAQSVSVTQHERVLADLGVVPIWYDDHSEIPDILQSIQIE